MDISKYALFAKTAELKNLTLAAEALGYTQSSASHIITSLERELGFSLFYRSRSGMELTSDGQAVLPAVYDLLRCGEQILQIASSIRGLTAGTVRVASFSSVTICWLSKIAGDFHTKYPGIDIEIVDGSYEKIRSWIGNGRVDCGFLVDTRIKDMSFLPLCRDTLYAVFPCGHRFEQYESLSVPLLSTETFILPSEGTLRDIRYLMGDFHPKTQHFTNTISDTSALSLVQNGLGISILPGILLQSAPLNQIAFRKIDSCKYHTLGLATHKKRYISPAIKCFLTFVKDWCANHQDAMQFAGYAVHNP